MKKLWTVLLAWALLCPAKAKAAEQVWLSVSSVTFSLVTVSTSAATRIDNLNQSTSSFVLAGRTKIALDIPSGANKINCNYGLAVSTQQSSVSYGSEYATTSTQSLHVDIELPISMTYSCMSQAAAAGANIHMTQFAPLKINIP